MDTKKIVGLMISALRPLWPFSRLPQLLQNGNRSAGYPDCTLLEADLFFDILPVLIS